MFWGERKHGVVSHRCCQSHGSSHKKKSMSASAIFAELQSELWITKESMSTASRDFCRDHLPILHSQLTADLLRFSKEVHSSQILKNSPMYSAFFFCILWHACLQVGTLHWHYASDASRRTLCSNVLGSGSLEDRTGSSGAGTVWRYFGSNAEVEK